LNSAKNLASLEPAPVECLGLIPVYSQLGLSKTFYNFCVRRCY